MTLPAMRPPAATSRSSTSALQDLPADCVIDRPEDIAANLRALLDAEVPLSLSAPDGTVLSTALWAEDRARGLVVLSASGDVQRAERLAECNEAVAVGYVDSVRVQFELVGLVLVHGHDAAALNAEYPRALMRFQRRDAYRVRPLDHAQPVVHVSHPQVPDALLMMRVTDVSHGGMALISPHAAGAFRVGQLLPDAVLELDHHTQISLGLRIVRVDPIGGDAADVRLGCELVQLLGEDARALQRYIDSTQRRRRMLTL